MLKLKNVSVNFKIKNNQCIPVVENVSLTINNNEKIFIIGETGSGKSILLLSILNLLPSNAKISGDIFFENTNISNFSRNEVDKLRGSKISYIPQGNASAFNPLIKIWKQIAAPLLIHKICAKEHAYKAAISKLEELDFENASKWGNLYPHNLSGGMKQRALIAMGTITNSKLILADEPTKGLDEYRRSEIEKIFNSFIDKSILCVTHDLYFAQNVASKIIVMYAAQVIEICDKSTFFKNPLHPYSQMMINSLVENGMKYVNGFAPPHTDYKIHGCRFKDRCIHASSKCNELPPIFEFNNRKVRCWIYDKT